MVINIYDIHVNSCNIIESHFTKFQFVLTEETRKKTNLLKLTFLTKYYQRSTNKRGDVMGQVLQKRNRLELLTLHPLLVELIFEKKKNYRAKPRIHQIVEEDGEVSDNEMEFE